MDFQYTGWRSHSPDSMYSQNQYYSPYASSNLASTSHRRPLPPKVLKPTSRNGSPRHMGRRRTTTNVPVTRTRSMLDQERSSNLYPSSANPKPHARPLSWHPNSHMELNFSTKDYFMNVGYQPCLQQPPYTFHGTTLANGLVTPMSYPVLNEPHIHELITPLEELSAQEEYGYPTGCYNNNNCQNWAQPEVFKDHMDTTDRTFPQMQPQEMWQWSNLPAAMDPPTAPSSPNFLPIQGGIEPSNELEDGEEELVGMGLYDSPADVQSSSLLFGGAFGDSPKKKPLKLAESFEPPENASADEDDDDDDDGDANEEQEEEEEEEEDDENVEQETEEVPSVHEDEMHDGRQGRSVQQAPLPNSTSTLAGQSFYFESEPPSHLPFTTYTQIDPMVTAIGGYQQQHQQQYQGFGYGMDYSATS